MATQALYMCRVHPRNYFSIFQFLITFFYESIFPSPFRYFFLWKGRKQVGTADNSVESGNSEEMVPQLRRPLWSETVPHEVEASVSQS
jgi:hypothetical protein